jgi:hypothetical protein
MSNYSDLEDQSEDVYFIIDLELFFILFNVCILGDGEEEVEGDAS